MASKTSKPNSSSSSSPVTNRSSPKASSPSAPPSQTALKLAYTLGYVFLPSDVEIIEIGKILAEGEAKEWNDKVKRVDMYSDTPYVLLAEAFPTIKLKNTYLVWTPRRVSKKGSGIDRDLKIQKGGYWYAGGGKIPVKDGEKVVGYFRILKYYEGGKGGIGGVVTDWSMKEFFVSEGFGNDFVICTVMFENSENKRVLGAFDKAREVLERNATSSRGTKLVTDRAISKGGKRAPQAKAKESVVGLVGSDIDVGTQIAPVARRTRSQSIKLEEASGSGTTSQPKITGQKDADKKKQGTELNRFKIKGIKGNKVTLIRVQDPEPPAANVVPQEAPRVLAPRVETHAERAPGRELGVSAAEESIKKGKGSVPGTLKPHDAMTTRNKKRGGTSGTVKASTRDASTSVDPDHLPVQEVVPPVVPLQVPVIPVQAPAVAPHVEALGRNGAVEALGRKVGLSVAQLESMTDEQYYDLNE